MYQQHMLQRTPETPCPIPAMPCPVSISSHPSQVACISEYISDYQQRKIIEIFENNEEFESSC